MFRQGDGISPSFDLVLPSVNLRLWRTAGLNAPQYTYVEALSFAMDKLVVGNTTDFSLPQRPNSTGAPPISSSSTLNFPAKHELFLLVFREEIESRSTCLQSDDPAVVVS